MDTANMDTANMDTANMDTANMDTADPAGAPESPGTIALTVRIVLSANDLSVADRLVAGLRDLGTVVVEKPVVPHQR